jgi:RNA polymerase sigma-70 factor, ECF subfamily
MRMRLEREGLPGRRGTGTALDRVDMLDAARAGDEDAFRALIDLHRIELHRHCSRMLGSVHDADDAFQEAMLRAWRGLTGLTDGARLRPWLYRIATNTCLDAIKRRPERGLAIERDQARLADPDCHSMPESRYEQREATALAYIAALRHLPARQRATLVLREVFGFSAREVAGLLDTTVPSVNSALQRARKTVDERRLEQDQEATVRAIGDERIRDLVERFADAFETRDVDRIVTMLA